MKAFLQRDDNGLFYEESGSWVDSPRNALAFATRAEAERFQEQREVQGSHVVTRLDPALVARLSSRAPGAYQAGE